MNARDRDDLHSSARQLLYLDVYTTAGSGPKATSDAIGYGLTASGAIQSGLQGLGFDVRRPDVASVEDKDPRLRSISWTLANYQATLEALAQTDPAWVFIFHSFRAWPTEVRHMLLEVGKDIPLVGYTHGSHWDPSDYVRTTSYPGLEMADLANLLALDRLLLVSEYMRETLERNVAQLNRGLARTLVEKSAVVGLPLNTDLMDRARPAGDAAAEGAEGAEIPTMVFNHAPVAGKNPELFLRVIARILRDHEVRVLFTRDFPASGPGGADLAALAQRFPDQVRLGRNLGVLEYFEALWRADIQVSTAEHESLGVSTLEAMYTYNCCILPELGSYGEITGHHPDVLYPLSEQALEERIRHFLDHPADRRRVAEQLHRQALRYAPARVVAAVADALP